MLISNGVLEKNIYSIIKILQYIFNNNFEKLSILSSEYSSIIIIYYLNPSGAINIDNSL